MDLLASLGFAAERDFGAALLPMEPIAASAAFFLLFFIFSTSLVSVTLRAGSAGEADDALGSVVVIAARFFFPLPFFALDPDAVDAASDDPVKGLRARTMTAAMKDTARTTSAIVVTETVMVELEEDMVVFQAVSRRSL